MKINIKIRMFILVASLLLIASAIGLYTFFNSAIHYRNRVAVLTYHNIGPEESTYTITPESFHAQLQALRAHHYNVIPVEDLIRFLQGKKPVPPNAVVITFDDGYESFYTYAYPELKKMGMTATNFVIVSYVGQAQSGLPFLKWDEMKEMKRDGFSFYSHTYNSHALQPVTDGKMVAPLTSPIFLPKENRMETEEEYRKRVASDLSLSDTILHQEIGNDLDLLCFPHGIYNETLIQLANQAGIQYFFTGEEGFSLRGSTNIKRITAGVSYVSAARLIRILNVNQRLYYKIRNHFFGN